MKKGKDYSKFNSANTSIKTNYRIKFTIGKDLGRVTKVDGFGLAKNRDEAERNFKALLSKTWGVLNAELYFENQLIKKR